MSNHHTHTTSRDTDTGTTWITRRPTWAAGAPLQTELVTGSNGPFWIAYPLAQCRTTPAQRIQHAPGRGPTIGDALRMANLP